MIVEIGQYVVVSRGGLGRRVTEQLARIVDPRPRAGMIGSWHFVRVLLGKRWSASVNPRHVVRIATPKDFAAFGIGVCRQCGCNDYAACDGGCAWYEPGLCTTCYVKNQTGGARLAVQAFEKTFGGAR